MATILTTPATTDSGDSGAGWAIAVLILLVVIGGGVYFWMQHRGTTPTTNGGTNINVTLPKTPMANPTPTP